MQLFDDIHKRQSLALSGPGHVIIFFFQAAYRINSVKLLLNFGHYCETSNVKRETSTQHPLPGQSLPSFHVLRLPRMVLLRGQPFAVSHCELKWVLPRENYA